MQARYITIEREYGSGGTEIAARAARACRIPSYGREIMEQVAEKQHVSVSELEQYEESVSGSLIYSCFVMSQSQTGDPDLLSQEAKLYVAETRVIKALAENGPAIFVGHCACQALQDRDDVLRVYIRADRAAKEKRIAEEYHVPQQEIRAVSRRADKRRANYYAFCTRKKWNDLRNYDLVLDSTRLGIDGCAAVLSVLLEKK